MPDQNTRTSHPASAASERDDTGAGDIARPAFDVADAMAVKSFTGRTPLHLSPDGDYLAYVIQEPQTRVHPLFEERVAHLPTGIPLELNGSQVWVVHLPTGESRRLACEQGMDWSPRWSPDGRHLAFYSDRTGVVRLWIWDRIEDRQRQLNEVTVQVAFGWETPQWTPDGRYLITKIRPDGLARSDESAFESIASEDGRTASMILWQTGQDEVDPEGTPANPLAFAEHMHGDIALFDSGTGGAQRLAQGLYTVDIALSPDGGSLAVLNLTGRGELTSPTMVFELLLVPLNGDGIQRLASNIEGSQVHGTTLSWSPDGRHLAYISSGRLFLAPTDGAELNEPVAVADRLWSISRRPLWSPDGNSLFCIADGHLWQVTRDGRSLRNLTEGLGREVTGAVASASTHVVWSPDGGQSVTIQTHHPATKQDGFQRIQLADVNSTCLTELPAHLEGAIRFDLDAVGYEGKILYRAEDATHPQEAWVVDAELKERRQVTQLNPSWSHGAAGPVRSIDWEAEDGRLLRGVLMLPANYEEGRLYPLITWLSGGEFVTHRTHSFGFSDWGEINFQLLAHRGYAVFAVGTPLQTCEPLKEIPGLVLPGVDKVIEIGIADAERLGIMGYSYGGYSVTALIGQTKRFKAAVSGGGIYNLTSWYGALSNTGHSFGISWCESGQGRMRGSLWEHCERYIENSPVFHLGKVETPLLLYCGALDADGAVFAQASEMFSGLRRLGKTAVLLCYPGENHNIPRCWNPDHLADIWRRILDWFDTFL